MKIRPRFVLRQKVKCVRPKDIVQKGILLMVLASLKFDFRDELFFCGSRLIFTKVEDVNNIWCQKSLKFSNCMIFVLDKRASIETKISYPRTGNNSYGRSSL